VQCAQLKRNVTGITCWSVDSRARRRVQLRVWDSPREGPPESTGERDILQKGLNDPLDSVRGVNLRFDVARTTHGTPSRRHGRTRCSMPSRRSFCNRASAAPLRLAIHDAILPSRSDAGTWSRVLTLGGVEPGDYVISLPVQMRPRGSGEILLRYP